MRQDLRLSYNDFAVALDAVKSDYGPSPAHVDRLLAVTDPHEAELLFKAARELRERHFGRTVFLYGFVYFSTYCRNRCYFCYYRRSNSDSPRYRKSPDEIAKIARRLACSGVHLIDLTMGEDPLYYENRGFRALADITRMVHNETGCSVMVSPGVVPEPVLASLRASGADWYACYQETHSRSLFGRLRPGQDYDRRAFSRIQAMETGLLVEDGIMVGVGESRSDRVHSLLEMRRTGAQQVRVMGFVPQQGTPLGRRQRSSPLTELVTLATMRILMPERLIPASLDVDGKKGIVDRLWAGANVVTSIIPPHNGLAGVSQAELDIDGGGRTVSAVSRQISELSLEVGTPEEYRRWISGSRVPCVKTGSSG